VFGYNRVFQRLVYPPQGHIVSWYATGTFLDASTPVKQVNLNTSIWKPPLAHPQAA